mgnify:CR=1 FL=1
MAVPFSASAAISLEGIAAEMFVNDYSNTGAVKPEQLLNISLEDASTGAGAFIAQSINTTHNNTLVRPNGSAPHKMSEFQGYDHDSSAMTTALTSIPTSFTLELDEAPDVATADKTIVLEGSTITNTVITCPSEGSAHPTLTVGASTTSAGHAQSGHAATKTLINAAIGTMYMQFKLTGTSALAEDEEGEVIPSDTTRAVTIVNNGVSASINIQCTQEDV